jgi:hypothetical protein
MTRGAVFVTACLVLLTALASPGLCPCWLLRDVGVVHPHLITPESPDHPHDYLFDLHAATADAAVFVTWTPVGALLTALAAASLWHRSGDPFLHRLDRQPRPLRPPPKTA